MKLRRIRAVTRKEWKQIVRDTRSLMLSLGIPMLLIVLFSWALKLDVSDIKTLVIDRDRTPASREYIGRFAHIEYFDIVGYSDDYNEAIHGIDVGDLKAVIVIPKGFGADLKADRGADVQLITDGSDPLTAQVLVGYVTAITSVFSQEHILDALSKAGVRTGTIPLDVSVRVWFNPEMESKNFIIPGLIAVIMMVIAGLLTSLTIAREWERGTMEQLISTPVTVAELLIGKLIPYVELGLIDFILALLVGTLIFGVPLKGSIVLLFVMTIVFLVGAMSLGLLISIIAKKQVQASQMAILITFLPSFIMSGFVFPISNMPLALKAITYIVPARYFVTILKGIFLKGVGVSILWAEGILLLCFTAVIFVLAMRKFKKEL
jgi:ABC-2 type transport system permease protein